MFRKILKIDEKNTPVNFNIIPKQYRDRIIAVNDLRELWWGKMESEDCCVIELATTRSFLYDGDDNTLTIKRNLKKEWFFDDAENDDFYVIEELISKLNEGVVYVCYRLSNSYQVFSGNK